VAGRGVSAAYPRRRPSVGDVEVEHLVNQVQAANPKVIRSGCG